MLREGLRQVDVCLVVVLRGACANKRLNERRHVSKYLSLADSAVNEKELFFSFLSND